MTRHCHACGWVWTSSLNPGRSESCNQCGAYLRVCLNCKHYDVRSAHQCRDRRADPVQEKAEANYCEFFEMGTREFTGSSLDTSREDAARENLRKLLGD